MAETTLFWLSSRKRDENLLAELHDLEWSQSDERQPSWQLPSSLLPVPKAQTAAWATGTDSQHSNSREQGKSGENDGPWGNAPLPPGTFPTLLSHFQMLLEKTNCSFPQTAATFQLFLTPSLNSCTARAYLLIREKGKTGKGTSEREHLLMWVIGTTGAVPWGQPGAISERVQSAPIGKGSGWPRGKGDIAMLEFTTLSGGSCTYFLAFST